MGYPPYLTRLFGYRQLQLAALDTVVDPAKLDIELNALVSAYNALAKRERAYTTPSGALTQVPSPTSLSLSSSTRFVATAGQTSFVVPTYDTGTDTVEAWTGTSGSGMTMIDPNSVTKTDATHVALPAQTLGQIVVILVFSSGSGVLATLAVDGTSGGTSGASLIGFFGNGLFISHTVEGALVEFATTYNAFIAALGSVGNVLRADGSVPLTGDLDADSNKIVNLSPGTVAGDSVEYSQFASFANVWNALQAYYAKLDGTTPWTGDWQAGNHKLTGLKAGTAANDAVNLGQITAGVSQSGKNSLINGAAIVAQRADYVAAVSGTYRYGKVDRWIGALTGSAVAGTLTQGASAAPGSSGYSVKWDAVTLTGSGTAVIRQYIEGATARRFLTLQPFVGVNVKHSCLAAINVTVNVYYATTAEHFSAGMTLVGSFTTLVQPGVDTRLTGSPLSSGGVSNAANGLCYEVLFTAGACAGVTFEIADAQIEPGAATQFEFEEFAAALVKCQRFFTRIAAAPSQGFTYGLAVDTQHILFALALPVAMRPDPGILLATSSTAAASFVAEDAVTAVATALAGLQLALSPFGKNNTGPAGGPAQVLLVGTKGSPTWAFGDILYLKNGGSPDDAHLDFDAELT